MATVLLERVTKQFPDATIAVDGVSLEIEDQEILVLVGPSGCGKSTTLRLIAGLETSTSGVLRIGGCDVTNVAPKDRDIAMVFQNYALYPHMSVYKNLSFGLTLRLNKNFGGGVLGRGLRKIFRTQRAVESAQLRAEIDNKVRQTALRLGIEHLLNRKPHQLSGGERQRVALGRAIVRNPAAFLLDEPLSNLDAKLRQQMRVELKRLHRELDATMIYVTHDQVEAMTLGDRVAVMNDGKILQVGSPLEIYQQPANLFVAKFIGSVPINLCPGTVRKLSDRIRFESRFRIEWNSQSPGFERLCGLFEGDKSELEVVMGFRAEDIRLSTQPGSFEVEVTEIDRLGESTTIHTRVCGPQVNEPEDDNLRQSISTGDAVLARLDPDANLASGDRVKLTIDSGRMLWFDPDSGENLLKERK
jgi:ABC-type sugar transport system ATPase subunit